MRKIFKTLTIVFILSLQIFGKNNIPLNNPYIFYDGIWFVQKSVEKVVFNRHTEEVLLNPESGISAYSRPYAYTQTGVKIRFKTKSRNIYFSFENREGSGKAGLHNGFTVYADGKKYKIYETLNFTITFPKPDTQSVLYEVVLPSLNGVNLTNMSLDDNSNLEQIDSLNKPVLAVIGTSISHGTGQQSSSPNTYPFILAENMGWELVNLAVAGAYTGWPMAQLVKKQRVDYIIVELGFNDWMWDDKPLSVKDLQYNRLIDTLRANQKNAKIICITPIVTAKKVAQKKVDFSLDDYREMVCNIVEDHKNKGDKNIFVIHGESLTSVAMLDDGVHLSVNGANEFAKKLTNKLNEIINSNELK